MAWKDIIGQNRTKNILQKAILEKRLPGAYFLWGLEGIGKDAIALEFAKTVNCHNPIITENGIDACGECPSCKKARDFKHPNIVFISSLPAGKAGDSKNDSPYAHLTDEQLELLREEMNHKAADPYYKIQMPNANQIRVSSIRSLKKSLMLTATEKGRRCIIISNADQMNTEAANAFLKTLEEPHDNITILMTCSRQEMILQTILSRCQQVFCEPLPDEAVAEALVNRNNIPEAEAKLAAAFAQGSYSKALEFLDDEMKKMRMDVVETFRVSLKKRVYRNALFDNIEGIIKQKDKNITEIYLKLLLLWLRDAYLFALTNDQSKILNIDQTDIIQRFSTNFSDKDFQQAIATIEYAIGRIRKNVQIQLILISMFIQLRKIFLN